MTQVQHFDTTEVQISDKIAVVKRVVIGDDGVMSVNGRSVSYGLVAPLYTDLAPHIETLLDAAKGYGSRDRARRFLEQTKGHGLLWEGAHR